MSLNKIIKKILKDFSSFLEQRIIKIKEKMDILSAQEVPFKLILD